MATLATDQPAPDLMDLPSLLLFFAVGAFALRALDQRRRIALLGQHLGHFQIERLMERLNQAYMRALGETDPQRRALIWLSQQGTEAELVSQFNRFAAELEREDASRTRISRVAWPLADRWLPGSSFDLRQLMRVHAKGIAQAVANPQALADNQKAFTLLAELYLMQHSCHWFCRTRATASARLLARHQTAYAQVLQAVTPETRAAYTALVGSSS